MISNILVLCFSIISCHVVSETRRPEEDVKGRVYKEIWKTLVSAA